MKAIFSDLARAQAAEVEARAVHEAAAADLKAAEAAVGPLLDKVWRANADAVQEAKADYRAAVENLALASAQVSTTAKARDPKNAELNEQEIAHVEAARSLVREADERIQAAIEQFKAGVTAERLADLDEGD